MENSLPTSRWAGWRAERRRTGLAGVDHVPALPARPLVPPRLWAPPQHRTADCATCWGQRMIWEPGPLGLLPVVCDGCAGTGRVSVS
ncbi:MAG: hypothetical protein QOD86_1159 [Miltoncostaeaceae bacterium]|jgi:hypothetical protein|nr:hypothetical protein [Miltoncostaeaceae bacterium]